MLSAAAGAATVLAALGFVGFADAQTCSTTTVASSVPSSTAVALNEFSYCGGTLYVQAFIENLCYNKVINLYYTNADNQSTPLDSTSLGYDSSIDGTNYEYWSATTPEVNLDGITDLLNLTYQAVDISETYVEQLGQQVIPSGPAPTTSTPPAPYATPVGFGQDISSWLSVVNKRESVMAKNLMFNNIEPADGSSGSIVAAQSYANPDYGYNWVRDSSLTMDAVATLYAANNNNYSSVYKNLFFRYAARRASEQTAPNLMTGLGEPKWNLDGSLFTGPWGRPQNDGPATAAITLMEFSYAFLAKGGSKGSVLKNIYNTTAYPAQAPVMKDLLFVASNWSSPTFDIWEEEEGDQFYDRMVSHRALVMGTTFANLLGDSETASTLSTAASECAATLPQFWSEIRNLILYEYGPVLHGKYSYKDTATMLAIIHGYANDGIYSFSNDMVLATAWQLATTFYNLYPIASANTQDGSGRTLGIPIGRYPEDTYDGTSTDGVGNPWYLCTASVAEVFYRASTEFTTAGQIAVTNISLPFWQYFAPQVKTAAGKTYKSNSATYKAMIGSLQGWGDAFLRVIKYYAPTGHLSEEIDRSSGQAVGAIDLTWSYAALLTASFARAQAIGNTGYARALGNTPTAPNTTYTS